MFQVGQALGQVGQALGQVPVSSPGPELPLAFPCEQQPAQEEVHHHDEELDLFEMMSILVFQGCCLSFRVLVSYHDFWFVLQVLHDFCCCFRI